MADTPNTIQLYPNGATIFNDNYYQVSYVYINYYYGTKSKTPINTFLIDPSTDFFASGDGGYFKFQYDNHTFLHWNTAADDNGTIYNIGDITPQIDGFILYAIWEEDSASSDSILTTTYGSITNNITSYGTFTLNTKGKFCQNDIVLEYTPEETGGSELIDLTGTTWYFNEEVDSSSLIQGNNNLNFYINFTTNNTSRVTIQISSDPNIFYLVSGNSSEMVYDANFLADGWTDEAYRTISITGGTDATNPDLIAWLQANATQIS